MKLLLNALVKLILGIVLVGLLVFLPAGTLEYTGGWLFMGLLFVPMLILGIVLFIKSPELLKRRLDSKEKTSSQKGVVKLSGLVFTVGFVISGLDFRFSYSRMPLWITVTTSVLFIGSYILYAEVMRENAYLSRTVKVEEGQKVIDTGLYGIVRHPMYIATVIMFLMIPLILGSWCGAIVFLSYPAIIIFRISEEEKLLEKELEGYAEYKKKVKYRLIPFIY